MAAVIGATALLSLAACSVQPPADAWVLSPIRYDNRVDDRAGLSRLIDVSYPMTLISDTAGGFWGISGSSWLHIDNTGAAARRFSTEVGDPDGVVAAVTPTQLVIGTLGGSIFLFDTELVQWTKLYADGRSIGDIAIADGVAYVVAYTFEGSALTFTIEKLRLDLSAAPAPIGPAFDGTGPVALDVDDEGFVYLATEDERIVVAPDGTIHSRELVRSSIPAVAVNGAGTVAWSHDIPVTTEQDFFVAGGSYEARQIIDRHVHCDPADYWLSNRATERITLAQDSESSTLSFLCAPAGFTWINDRELVLSLGHYGGAVLVRLTPPMTAERPH